VPQTWCPMGSPAQEPSVPRPSKCEQTPSLPLMLFRSSFYSCPQKTPAYRLLQALPNGSQPCSVPSAPEEEKGSEFRSKKETLMTQDQNSRLLQSSGSVYWDAQHLTSWRLKTQPQTSHRLFLGAGVQKYMVKSGLALGPRPPLTLLLW
jgi:hypothetical protein